VARRRSPAAARQTRRSAGRTAASQRGPRLTAPAARTPDADTVTEGLSNRTDLPRTPATPETLGGIVRRRARTATPETAAGTTIRARAAPFAVAVRTEAGNRRTAPATGRRAPTERGVAASTVVATVAGTRVVGSPRDVPSVGTGTAGATVGPAAAAVALVAAGARTAIGA
jgi:hypothetical protein